MMYTAMLHDGPSAIRHQRKVLELGATPKAQPVALPPPVCSCLRILESVETAFTQAGVKMPQLAAVA